MISINFPRTVSRDIRVKLVRASKLKFSEKIDVRVDPRGGKYYWLFGSLLEPEENTDTYVVHKEGNIALTPLTLDMNAMGPRQEVDMDSLNRLVDVLNTALIRFRG